MSKIPFILVTGFLGSGKTTLLRELLVQYSERKRILLVQNEFADSGVDGAELAAGQWNFSLLEMNKGSVFCVCLFSDFKQVMTEQIAAVKPDMVVLEATGIADPVAIGQLINDPEVGRVLYLSHIWCVADAVNLMKMKDGLRCIPNQIRVADTVVVNKCDCVDREDLPGIDSYIKGVNPYADILHTSFCNIDFKVVLDRIFSLQPVALRHKVTGDLTKCNERQMSSQVFKTTQPIAEQSLENFLGALPEGVVRIKGFVRVDDGRSVMVQYVAGSYGITPLDHDLLTTELIAIGTTEVDFQTLCRV